MPKNKRNVAPLPTRPIGIALLAILSLLLSTLPVLAESTHGQLPERPGSVTAAETDPPTLLSLEVPTSGDLIILDFDKELHTDSARLPPVTAFSLLADQTEVNIAGIVLPRAHPKRLLLIPRHKIYEGESSPSVTPIPHRTTTLLASRTRTATTPDHSQKSVLQIFPPGFVPLYP